MVFVLRLVLPEFVCLFLLAFTVSCMAAPASAGQEELEELKELRKIVSAQQKQIEALADAWEAGVAGESDNRTRLGGYGEMHYGDLDSGREMDFHRFVLFVSHKFSETVSFHSELELEHSVAGEGQPGEIELEQAYVQWDFTEGHHLKTGLFLVPAGLINETHEPETFYGVERNPVEKNIIPSTWWEGGVALNGEITAGWSYDLAVHSGLHLDTDNVSASKRTSIRSGRQKVGEANADSLAWTGRIRYTGVPGLLWGLSAQYQEDLSQDEAGGIALDRLDARLLETHLVWQSGSFSLSALYANWKLDKSADLLNPGAKKQTGWYVEPSWRINAQWGVFARYSSYDLTAGDSLTSNQQQQTDVGVNYWLHERVVFKLDFQRQSNDQGSEVDGFNLGVGYSF